MKLRTIDILIVLAYTGVILYIGAARATSPARASKIIFSPAATCPAG
jgi:hypothetical protein